jgi:hypothetical protein
MRRGPEKSEHGGGLTPETLRRSVDEERGFKKFGNISADWKNIDDQKVPTESIKEHPEIVKTFNGDRKDERTSESNIAVPLPTL